VGSNVEAVLFVNFKATVRFNRKLKEQMRLLRASLVDLVPAILEELRSQSPFPAAELLRILQPVQQLASGGIPGIEAMSPESCFHSILQAALEAFHVPAEEGFGTIHLYRPESQRLERVACVGPVDVEVPFQDVTKGEGIISWVALRRKALLIDDLSNSDFGPIHKRVRNGIRSELAVPMLADDELLGVLNLESVRPSAFSGHASEASKEGWRGGDATSAHRATSVRTMWYAAGQAAIACRISRHVAHARELAQRTLRLLSLCHQAATGEAGAELALQGLARLACQSLQADKCDIWYYDSASQTFDQGAASYDDFHVSAGPRPNGWTHHIHTRRHAIWIGDVKSVRRFRVLCWNPEALTWSELSEGPNVPTNVNPILPSLRVRTELGIPIFVRGDCVAVAWLKYHADHEVPAPLTIDLAIGFAAHAALVIDCLGHHKEVAEEWPVSRVQDELREALFRVGPLSLPGLDGYVISRPCKAKLGGDFHAPVEIDGNTSGFLIGDAESHGLSGGLAMLPLMAVLRTSSLEKQSPRRILEKFLAISCDFKIRGTALYFICGTIDVCNSDGRHAKKRWLLSSTAGHPPLIVCQPNKVFDFPDPSGPANCGMLGLHPALFFTEDRCELSPGDLIVACTDGIFDSVGPLVLRGEILKNFDKSLEEIARSIEAKAVSGGRLRDDATIVVLRVVTPPEELGRGSR